MTPHDVSLLTPREENHILSRLFAALRPSPMTANA